MRLNLDFKKPVLFGVLCCLTEKQSLERAGTGTTYRSLSYRGTTIYVCLMIRSYSGHYTYVDCGEMK